MQEMEETGVQPLGQEDPLEEGMATDSSILAWRVPWTERSLLGYSPHNCRVRHDWSNLAHTYMGITALQTHTALVLTLVKPTLNSFYWYEIPITLLSKTDCECLTFIQLWKPLWGIVFLSSSASEQERNSGQSDKLLKSRKVSQTISQIWTTSYGTTYNEYY